MKKFVVWQKYFNNGKVKAGIKEIEEQEVEQFIDFKETDNDKYIRAANLKSAKWIFAIEQGLKGIDYIAGKF